MFANTTVYKCGRVSLYGALKMEFEKKVKIQSLTVLVKTEDFVIYATPNMCLGVRFGNFEYTSSRSAEKTISKISEAETPKQALRFAFQSLARANPSIFQDWSSFQASKLENSPVLVEKVSNVEIWHSGDVKLSNFGIYNAKIENKSVKLQYAIFSNEKVAEKAIRDYKVVENCVFAVFSRILVEQIAQLSKFLDTVTEELVKRGVNLLELSLNGLDFSRLGRSFASAGVLLSWMQKSRDLGLTVRFKGVTQPLSTFSFVMGGLAQTDMKRNQIISKYRTCFYKIETGKIYDKKLKKERDMTETERSYQIRALKGAVSDLLNNRSTYFIHHTDEEMYQWMDENLPNWSEYANLDH